MKGACVQAFIALTLACLFVSCAKDNVVESLPPGRTFDVFPLAVGDHYTYSYYEQQEGHYWGNYIDSGLVEYRINNSTMSTSLKQWAVEETRHILHRQVLIGGQNRISPYWEDSTVTLSLSESLSGFHDLLCSGLVWSFPLLNGFVNATPVPVYRYSGSPAVPYSAFKDYGDAIVIRLDSVWLDSDSGLTYKVFRETGWAMSIERPSVTARLITRTVGKPTWSGNTEGILPEERRYGH